LEDERMVDEMYKLIRTIWETEKMPERWKLGIICLIYKKGDKLECGNYWGITLLNAAYKILTSIINERVQKVTERIIEEYQCGFSPNKGTTNQPFIIRQMIEKNWEGGFDLHMIFIDRVNRRKLSEAMEEVGTPQKLIKVMEMTLKDTKAALKINNRKTITFEFNTGMKQGDGLSTTLFIIALHQVIWEREQRGTIFNKLSQVCTYADDVVLITKTKRKLPQMNVRLETEARKIALLVNERKTKYMFMTAAGNLRKPHNSRIGNKVT
jgi:sorting nexin-29